MPVALTIAGTDSGGGAGIVADTATFRALGVWPTVAVTVVTAQNTVGVFRTEAIDPATVRAQIEAVATDMTIDAIKTGAICSSAIGAAVAGAIAELGLPRPVVDPVLGATTGHALGDVGALEPLVAVAAVVTPNLAEAAALAGIEVGDRAAMEEAGRRLLHLGCEAVLVTGGHLDSAEVADCLVRPGHEVVWFVAPRLPTGDLHGTGCVLSAAIAAHLARGAPLDHACEQGIGFVRAAIGRSRRLGHGSGPIDPGGAVSSPA